MLGLRGVFLGLMSAMAVAASSCFPAKVDAKQPECGAGAVSVVNASTLATVVGSGLADTQVFRVNENDQRLLNLICQAAASEALGEGAQATAVDAMAESLQKRVNRAPTRRWFILRSIKADLRAEGLWGVTAIDWEAIGDFIVKIAPIIFQLIDLFMGIEPAAVMVEQASLSPGVMIHGPPTALAA